MQLFERLCATFFLHTMPHLFPPAVSIVVKMSSPHCRMQKEGGFLMRLPWWKSPSGYVSNFFSNLKTTSL